jgi:hypothetical protein
MPHVIDTKTGWCKVCNKYEYTVLECVDPAKHKPVPITTNHPNKTTVIPITERVYETHPSNQLTTFNHISQSPDSKLVTIYFNLDFNFMLIFEAEKGLSNKSNQNKQYNSGRNKNSSFHGIKISQKHLLWFMLLS